MAPPSNVYEPRDPTSSPLYQIVRDHFETFRAHAASLRDGDGLPRFVEQEFRDFLWCGCLAGGSARFRGQNPRPSQELSRDDPDVRGPAIIDA